MLFKVFCTISFLSYIIGDLAALSIHLLVVRMAHLLIVIAEGPLAVLRQAKTRAGIIRLVDVFEEHLRGTYPESAIAIKRLIDAHRLKRFRIFRVADQAIMPTLEVNKLLANEIVI